MIFAYKAATLVGIGADRDSPGRTNLDAHAATDASLFQGYFLDYNGSPVRVLLLSSDRTRAFGTKSRLDSPERANRDAIAATDASGFVMLDQPGEISEAEIGGFY